MPVPYRPTCAGTWPTLVAAWPLQYEGPDFQQQMAGIKALVPSPDRKSSGFQRWQHGILCCFHTSLSVIQVYSPTHDLTSEIICRILIVNDLVMSIHRHHSKGPVP